MTQLRQDFKKISKLNTMIVVVGPEEKDSFNKYWQVNKLPFIGLPDPKHSVLKSYGQEVNLFKLGRMPAQVIVDKNGIARFVHYGHKMSDIPSADEIIETLKFINNESE